MKQQKIKRQERREQLRRETLAVWNEYQETGLHVTEAEAEAWLEMLEAGKDVEPPGPHD
jgi:predicted transcriptional regulator